MEEFRNIWVEEERLLVRSLLRSFVRSLEEYIENASVRYEGPLLPLRSTFRKPRERNRGVALRGPEHTTVAHVLDRGSTGLRSSRGSYVPFCINRETPRRTRTSGRFWNRLNPPASRDHEGMKVPEVPKALDISLPSLLFSFLHLLHRGYVRQGKNTYEKCRGGIPSSSPRGGGA